MGWITALHLRQRSPTLRFEEVTTGGACPDCFQIKVGALATARDGMERHYTIIAFVSPPKSIFTERRTHVPLGILLAVGKRQVQIWICVRCCPTVWPDDGPYRRNSGHMSLTLQAGSQVAIPWLLKGLQMIFANTRVAPEAMLPSLGSDCPKPHSCLKFNWIALTRYVMS